MMLDVGALTTITPAVVAVLMSTLSRPTPARATTFSTGAAAIASASIFVAERISTAFASARAESSAGRSVPSTLRTSKSGPRASIVAGESSSAIRTTGLDTAEDLRGGCTTAEAVEVPRRTSSGPAVSAYRDDAGTPDRVTSGGPSAAVQGRR